MASKVEVEVELKSKPEKLWNAIKDYTTLFSKAAPDKYERSEVLEGDGISVGTVALMKKTEAYGDSVTKQRLESLDEGNKTLVYSVIEGDVLEYLKNYKATFHVSEKGDGALVTYIVEMEAASEQVPDLALLKGFVIELLHQIDAYLLNEA
ncbi:MLP-like protein [Sesamum alatum]|uniref:MLP-like protein n=1 Tax=Sesamum alatum TaxID=300844 RepID=A0AAE1Y657_9LAMI|nr:MLP-like protein [Sesamum alatum]